MYRHIMVSLVLAVTLGTSANAAGERIALCIGINKYDDREFESLEYGEKDVTTFAAELRNVGYKVVLMTPSVGKANPELAPTKRNLDRQIEALVAMRKPDDLIVLAFVGHGMRFENDEAESQTQSTQTGCTCCSAEHE